MNYQRLLVTHDGSELADAALGHAAAISKATGAAVLVLRVSAAAGRDPKGLHAREWTDLVDHTPSGPPQEAEPHLSVTVDALRAGGVEHVGSLLVRDGDVGEAILDTASRLDVDLIAISSHGLSGVRRVVLGSVADFVIRHTERLVVLLCRGSAPGPLGYRRLLAALDGSELGDLVIPHIESLARTTRAEVVLFRAIDSVARVMTAMTSGELEQQSETNVEIAESSVAAQRSGAESELGAVAASLREAGVERVVVQVVEGEPGDAIVEAIESTGADLAVMGTHGRTGLGRALLGSVADHVAHNTDAPVLLVRQFR